MYFVCIVFSILCFERAVAAGSVWENRVELSKEKTARAFVQSFLDDSYFQIQSSLHYALCREGGYRELSSSFMDQFLQTGSISVRQRHVDIVREFFNFWACQFAGKFWLDKVGRSDYVEQGGLCILSRPYHGVRIFVLDGFYFFQDDEERDLPMKQCIPGSVRVSHTSPMTFLEMKGWSTSAGGYVMERDFSVASKELPIFLLRDLIALWVSPHSFVGAIAPKHTRCDVGFLEMAIRLVIDILAANTSDQVREWEARVEKLDQKYRVGFEALIASVMCSLTEHAECVIDRGEAVELLKIVSVVKSSGALPHEEILALTKRLHELFDLMCTRAVVGVPRDGFWNQVAAKVDYLRNGTLKRIENNPNWSSK